VIRRWSVLLALAVGLACGAVARGQAAADGAAKRLAAANGLYQRGLHKLAADEYAEFLREYPAHPEAQTARYAMAICRYRLGEHAAAAEALAVLAADANFAQRDEALAVLGHCHLALKQPDKAVAVFDELLAKYPQSRHAAAAALNRAQVLYAGGKSAEALAACEAYLRSYPDGASRDAAMYLMALCQQALARHADVEKTLAELARAHPTSAYQHDAALLLGQALEAQKKFDAAVEQYRKSAAAAPAARQAEFRFSLAGALHKAGRYDEAARQCTSLLAEFAGSAYAPAARLQLGLSQLAAGKPDAARQTLEGVARDDPQRATAARYWLAQCDIAQKKFEPALAALEALLKQTPPPDNMPTIAFDRAMCLLGLGRYEDAAGSFGGYRKEHGNAPQAAEAAYRQAFCLHKLGRYDQSHALCGEVIGAGGAFAPAARELDAENLFLLNNHAEAAKAFALLLENARDEDQRLRFTLRHGQCAYMAGDYAAAAQRLAPLADSRKALADDQLARGVLLLGDALLQTNKPREAAEALGKYLAVAKQDRHEAQLKLATAQLRSGDAAAAEKTLAELVKAPADSPWVQRGLLEYGQMLYRQNQHPRAAELLGKLLAANPPADLEAPAMYLLAFMEFDAKRYGESARRFAQLIQKHPRHDLADEAMFQRGRALQEAGDAAGALAAMQQYVAAYPAGRQAAAARQVIAASFTKLGKSQEAAKALASLAADKKTVSDAVLYDLAWALRETKDSAGSIAAYRRLLAEYPDSRLAPAARVELADWLYEDRQYEPASKLLEQAIADKRTDTKAATAARYRLGQCYEKLGQADKAAAVFMALAGQGADAAVAAASLYQAGVAYAGLGRTDEAEAALAQMLAKYPKDERASAAMLKLGEVQAQGGKHNEARQTYTQFLAAYPQSEFVYLAQFGIGWSAENQRKYDEARTWYKKVIDGHSGPVAARAQFQIGETYFAEGQYEKAAAALLAVEDVYAYPEWSARALLEAGRAFEQMKQKELARKQYATVISKYKDRPEAALAEKQLKALGG